MKLINIPRELVYTDRRTLDDFLREDDLNKELYKVYLRVKDKPYYFKFDAEDAFNEAYYIATMAMNDPHPELDVKEWLWIAKEDMGWRYAANLVMSMVYAILYLQQDQPEQIGYVLTIMEGQDYGEDHFPDFKAMAEQEKRRFKSDLSIRPYPIDELEYISVMHKRPISWQTVTEDFDQNNIRELVSLLQTKDERLKLIDLIEDRQKSLFALPEVKPFNIEDLPF